MEKNETRKGMADYIDFSTMRILFNYLTCMKIYVDFKIIKTF